MSAVAMYLSGFWGAARFVPAPERIDSSTRLTARLTGRRAWTPNNLLGRDRMPA